MNKHFNPNPVAGLVLSGGGARAAYQVGVLKAIDQIVNNPTLSPFEIITGTSAGAINACALASNANDFSNGIERLESVWKNFKPNHVYKTEFKALSKSFMRWSWNLFRPDDELQKPLSLLDNQPLKHLLDKVIRFHDIQANIDNKSLTAVCATAYNYTSGDSESFYQGKDGLVPWKRFRRFGKPKKLTSEHLLASSAIPMVFPSQQIDGAHYGDGAMRFLAPLSPALHLGANKLFVITVEPLRSDSKNMAHVPSIGDISGHMLDSIFIDSLESDIERLMRVNELLAHIAPDDLVREQLTTKEVDTFVISPSVELGTLAGQYFKKLPKSLRFFFNRLGINQDSGESILSYLLFDSSYTEHLIEIGYQDALKQSSNIEQFFNG